ncbi:MAG: hypothetical protein KJ667_02245, partial [Alphaproteobacteria bacterium]|nr:hypothetical protein [Alphaproteobacteria bacterium]
PTGAAVRHAVARQESVFLNATEMESCPLISIDHAVMERTAQGVVVGVDMGWSDLGTWPAILRNRWR